jgi:hypothetical protein
VGEQGAGFKRGLRARLWSENARTWRVHGGEIVGERLRTR